MTPIYAQTEIFNLNNTIKELSKAVEQHIKKGNSHTAMLKTAELHGKLAVLAEFERMAEYDAVLV